MSESHLQAEFLRVFAAGHIATTNRIMSRASDLHPSPELLAQLRQIVHDELRGLYHGSLVLFDGGSSLADHGLLRITDDNGTQFARNLHEIGFDSYDGPHA
jgi:hypothetical protein